MVKVALSGRDLTRARVRRAVGVSTGSYGFAALPPLKRLRLLKSGDVVFKEHPDSELGDLSDEELLVYMPTRVGPAKHRLHKER